MSPQSRFPRASRPAVFVVLAFAAAAVAAEDGDSPATSLVLARARQNHHGGDFAAAVTCIRDSYLAGRDTLTGVLEVRDAEKTRRLTLRGRATAFEWWSRRDGREQWRREGEAGRLRRLPPHSFRKPAFAPDISYEDLARLPFGYLDGAREPGTDAAGAEGVRAGFAPVGALAALYASLAATVGGEPALLRRIEFKGLGALPSRSMTIARYVATPRGWFPAEIVFAAADGLSSTRLLLELLPQDVVRDKATADGGPLEGDATFAAPRWVPRDDGGPVIGPAAEED